MKRIITFNRHFENGCEKCINCSILRWPLESELSSLTFQQPIFTFREYDMRYARNIFITWQHSYMYFTQCYIFILHLYFLLLFDPLYYICTNEQCFMPHKCWHFDFYQIKLQVMIRKILPRIIFKDTNKNRFILH